MIPPYEPASWLEAWGQRHGVGGLAMLELRSLLQTGDDPTPPQPPKTSPKSEAAVLAECRMQASKLGWRLWRNNTGVHNDPKAGIWVRYGLSNDSPDVNSRMKSGDLIGIKPLAITHEHVGAVIGQFISLEVKASNWTFRGTPREVAQANWARVINQMGGLAAFVTDKSQLT